MSFTSTKAVDVIAIVDSDDYTQYFSAARPIKASISESSKVMTHPVETGTDISDHVVDDPIEITLNLLLTSTDYRDVYADIKRAYTDRTQLLVLTRSGSYDSMIIQSMPHDESAAVANGLVMVLKLVQVIVVEAQYTPLPQSSVSNKSDSSTTSRGTVQGADTTSSQSDSASTLYELFGS